jgi:transposase|tara:strand:- start:54 stop:1268 length:1215 start_codon:yes stop_codon:yes gene_type:complete
MNSVELFSIALGLEAPWEIEHINFDKTTKKLDIHLGFQRGHKFKMGDGLLYSSHDRVTRKWRHLNFFEHECFLHAKVPRVKQSDGKIQTQEVPWARSGSGFTLLFEAFSMLLIESEMPVKKVANVLKVYPNRLWNVFKYWVSKAHKEDVVQQMKSIGFDETSIKKGHNYVTTMVDLKERRVLFVTPGKGADCIAKSKEYLVKKKVEVDAIKQVCIDMSPSFISGCINELPNAAITFDKFHVMKEVNKAMDELRKLERVGNESLKRHKYTFLKNKLTPKIDKERDLLLEYYPKLAEGYKLKLMFADFWDLKDKQEAEGYLAFWCDLAQESKIQPFIKASNTIKSHWSGIINYIESNINNGILEGLNSKIQLAKKRARGYRNIDNFINMIYFTCGKLKFDYPLYST